MELHGICLVIHYWQKGEVILSEKNHGRKLQLWKQKVHTQEGTLLYSKVAIIENKKIQGRQMQVTSALLHFPFPNLNGFPVHFLLPLLRVWFWILWAAQRQRPLKIWRVPSRSCQGPLQLGDLRRRLHWTGVVPLPSLLKGYHSIGWRIKKK